MKTISMALPKKKKKFSLLSLYHKVLVIGIVSFFFTYLDTYLYRIDEGLPPVQSIILLALFSTPVFLHILINKNLRLPLNLISWSALYLSISFLSFIYVSYFSSPREATFQELETRILSAFFLLLCALVFSSEKCHQWYARVAILLVTIVNVINNIYEFLNPGVFGGLNPTGRSAGFYIDPNDSSYALLFGLIFSVGIIPVKYRIPLVLFVGLGILSTFSRGGMICWLLIVMTLVAQRIIPSRQILFWGLISFAILALINVGALDNHQLSSGVVSNMSENAASRLAWFQDPSASQAHADDSRLEVVKFAWQKFGESPIMGNGIGYSRIWEHIGTHNIYLKMMLENGIVGAFIYPLLIFSVTFKARNQSKSTALAFAGFTLLMGLFTHNVIEFRYPLVAYSLMAAISVSSQSDSNFYPVDK